MLPFPSHDPLADTRPGPVSLVLHATYSPATSPWGVRAWRWHIMAGEVRVGTISLREGDAHVITHLLGHIGFAVDAAHRGRGYAGLAVRALLREAASLGVDAAWITTTPDNVACLRTLERIGCTFVEAVAIPPWYATWPKGERTKLRFRLPVQPEPARLPGT